jgi:tetratricopeptide (TPR) repeat protein
MKPGRNDPCPCGSGRKYKLCCGRPDADAATAAAAATQETSGALPDAREIGALVALLNQDRAGEAERGARQLLARHPEAGIAWKVLSVALARAGKDALPALRRAAQLLPGDAEAQRNLGAALHDAGLWEEALQVLQRALALRPNDVDPLLEAAGAAQALGRAAEAVAFYQRSLVLDPGSIEARNNLGNAYLALGRLEEAVDCYRAALAGRPDDARILRNLGSVLRDLGSRREALEAFASAARADPGNAGIHCDLGSAQFELRRVDEAAASYRRALELEPRCVPAHLGLALVLRQQRRASAAETTCRAALAIDPDNVEALASLGELLADRGQFTAAEPLFQRAIALNPAYAPAYASIASHRRMTSADAAWHAGAEGLLGRRLPLANEISLHYALGKYLDDLGQYDAAFDHFRQANELGKRLGSKYDRARLERRVDELIGLFPGRSVDAPGAAADGTELPVLIVGMPRSGTSLAEQILASHPSVYGAGEVIYWNSAYDRFRRARTEGKPLEPLLAAMGEEYLTPLRAVAGGAARVIDKMPGNFLYAGLIHAALPRVRIIHMQRHPFDTCLSIYFQNFYNIGPYANDLDDLGHYYRQYRRITDHWRTTLPAASLLEVPYESLVTDPETWSRRMVDFIGLPWDPRCLDFHATDRVVITASKWQVRQKISTRSAGRWRNYGNFVGPLASLLEEPVNASG